MELFTKVGTFTIDTATDTFMNKDDLVYWCIDTSDINTARSLVDKVDYLYDNFEKFLKKSKHLIAKELIEHKNDFWPEYDENDEDLDWEAVERGDFNVSVEEFSSKIKLLDLIIFEDEIYSEFKDGDLFGGHRIHATFTYNFKLKSADI